jgi:hypothetical protein
MARAASFESLAVGWWLIKEWRGLARLAVARKSEISLELECAWQAKNFTWHNANE